MTRYFCIWVVRKLYGPMFVFFKRSFTVAGSVAANAITPYVSKMTRFASNIIFIVIILFIHGQDGHNLVSLANAVSHHLANDRRNNTFCRNYFSIVSDKWRGHAMFDGIDLKKNLRCDLCKKKMFYEVGFIEL